MLFDALFLQSFGGLAPTVLRGTDEKLDILQKREKAPLRKHMLSEQGNISSEGTFGSPVADQAVSSVFSFHRQSHGHGVRRSQAESPLSAIIIIIIHNNQSQTKVRVFRDFSGTTPCFTRIGFYAILAHSYNVKGVHMNNTYTTDMEDRPEDELPTKKEQAPKASRSFNLSNEEFLLVMGYRQSPRDIREFMLDYAKEAICSTSNTEVILPQSYETPDDPKTKDAPSDSLR